MALLVGATVAFATWPDGHAWKALAAKQTRNPLAVGVVVGGFLAVVMSERRIGRVVLALVLTVASFALAVLMPLAALGHAALVASSKPLPRQQALFLVMAGAIALVAVAALVPRPLPTAPNDPVAASASFVEEGNLYRALDAARAAAGRDGAVPGDGYLQLARVAALIGDIDDARALARQVADGAGPELTRRAAADFLAELR